MRRKMAWTGTELYEQAACAEGDLGVVVVMRVRGCWIMLVVEELTVKAGDKIILEGVSSPSNPGKFIFFWAPMVPEKVPCSGR